MNGISPGTLHVSVDTGGTFTDFVAARQDMALTTLKVPSTPDDPSIAISEGIKTLLKRTTDTLHLRIQHGTTVGTNAILERSGGRSGLITNRGFEDLLALGRQNRPAIYDVHPHRAPPDPQTASGVGVGKGPAASFRAL